MLFSVHIRHFMAYLRFEKNASPRTVASYESDLLQLDAYMGRVLGHEPELDEVTYQDLRGWIISLGNEQVKAGSLSRKISSLKSCYKFLMRNGVITVNPAAKLVKPKLPRPLPVFVEHNQMALLEATVSYKEGFEGMTERLIMELLYQTGMRRAELIGLKNNDWDQGRRVLWVWGKGNKQRMIPLSDAVIKLLTAYTAEKNRIFGTEPENLLLLKSGKPLYPMYVERVVNRYLQSVTTLKKKSPHVMRHTFATELYNNGADLRAIEALLGHASLAATQVYVHTNIEKLKETFRKKHPRA